MTTVPGMSQASFPIRGRLDSSGLKGAISRGSSLPDSPLFKSIQEKDPEHLPKDPTTFFPLTRDNITTNLPRILRQFYSYDYSHINSYKAITAQLYTKQVRCHSCISHHVQGQFNIAAAAAALETAPRVTHS